jgi:hypothetical protein
MMQFDVGVPSWYRSFRLSFEMSIFEDKKDEFEKYETMFGVPRGRLAVTLDVLTDALVLAGQHGVYCRSNTNPAKPATDLQIVHKSINDAKAIITSVMEELKKENKN